jgi:PAS domain S-box-containing protein
MTEENLLREEGLVAYRTLAENLPGMVYRVFIRENQRMQFFNDMLEQMTGFRADELTHGEVCSIDPLIHPEDRGRVISRVKRAIEEDTPFEVEYRLRHKDGSLHHVLERGRPIRGADGQPLFIDGVILDITARKRAEEALKESEARLQLAQKAAHAGIWDWHMATGELAWNEECYRLFGLTPAHGKPSYETWEQALHPADREACLASVARAIERRGELDIAYRVIHPDGSVHWLNSIGQPIYDAAGRPESMRGICLDISSRKAAEELLRSSHEELERRVRQRTAELHRLNEALRQEIEVRRRAEEAVGHERQRLLALLEALPAYVCLLAPDFSVTFTNREWRRRFGEADGRRCHDILFGLHQPCEGCQTARVFKTQTPLDWEGVGPDGRVYQIYDYPLADLDGTPLVLEMGLDITERKRAEDALQKSEARLVEAERIAHLGHWEWIIPTDEIVWSAGTYRIFHLSPQQFEPSYESFLSRVHPEDRTLVQARVADALAGIHPYSIDHRIVLPDGSVHWVHEAGEVTFGGDGKPVRMMGTVQDLTQRRQTEEALRESEQRLRYLTSQLLTAQEKERQRLSLELHDELGQSLQVLKLKIGAGTARLNEDQASLRHFCQEILTYLDGIIENVRRLSLDLSPAVLEDLGLASAIKFLLDELCKHYGIGSCTHQIDDIDQCFSPQAQLDLYRIFQESLNNIGKHAHASQISVFIRRQGDRVAFQVEDNGQGFDVQQVLSRQASARGLGLAAIDERLRRLGGSLQIWSQQGRGTRINFVLPMDK